jgi:hypothetical protein
LAVPDPVGMAADHRRLERSNQALALERSNL